MRNNPTLKRYFREYNRRYFGNALDDRIVVRWGDVDEDDEKDLRSNLAWYDPTNNEIVLGDRVRASSTLSRFTLLHEMAHVANPRSTHGKRWEEEMLRLARMGAFSADKNGGRPLW